MNINEQLTNLYKTIDIAKVIDDYNNKLEDKSYCATYPFFLKSFDKYETADIKIMFFGKETNGWHETYGSGVSVEKIMNVYESFYNNENYSYNGNFLSKINMFIKLLREKNSSKNIGFMWNNIVKMGYITGGFPHEFYNEIVKPYLNKIIPEEINILKSDYIIFFTGPNYYRTGPYDDVIDDVFNNPEKKDISGYKERELREIIIPGIKKALRTYHPGYLKRQKTLDEYFDKITDDISDDINKI